MDFLCVCPQKGFSSQCEMARGGLGHVKACPLNGKPCPCLPGGLSEAHCFIAAQTELEPKA